MSTISVMAEKWRYRKLNPPGCFERLTRYSEVCPKTSFGKFLLSVLVVGDPRQKAKPKENYATTENGGELLYQFGTEQPDEAIHPAPWQVTVSAQNEKGFQHTREMILRSKIGTRRSNWQKPISKRV